MESTFADTQFYKRKKSRGGGGLIVLRNTSEAREVGFNFIPSTKQYIFIVSISTGTRGHMRKKSSHSFQVLLKLFFTIGS